MLSSEVAVSTPSMSQSIPSKPEKPAKPPQINSSAGKSAWLRLDRAVQIRAVVSLVSADARCRLGL